MAPITKVLIESGRLIVLPIRLPPSSPMQEFFALVRVSSCPKRLAVALDPKTKLPCGFSVRPLTGPSDEASGKGEATIRGVYPYLYIGDPAFISPSFPDMNLMSRALKASAFPQLAGAFRMTSGEVGVSVRFGGRLAIAQYQGCFPRETELDAFSMTISKLSQGQLAEGFELTSEIS